MAGAAVRPAAIELDRTRELRIRWADGEASVYPLPLLRRACPCAACRSSREQEAGNLLPVVQTPELQRDMATAVTVELVGQYAIRVLWKDGHDTGIYDYGLLRSLAHSRPDPAWPGPQET